VFEINLSPLLKDNDCFKLEREFLLPEDIELMKFMELSFVGVLLVDTIFLLSNKLAKLFDFLRLRFEFEVINDFGF
jgi:hypothetical protein